MPLQYAALPRRGAAFLFDLATLIPALLLARESIWLAASASALWWAAFEASPWQASPGKRLLGLKSIQSSGRRLRLPRALCRSALKTAPALLLPLGDWPIGAWLAAAAAAVSFIGLITEKRHRCLHDLICRTAVIRPPVNA